MNFSTFIISEYRVGSRQIQKQSFFFSQGSYIKKIKTPKNLFKKKEKKGKEMGTTDLSTDDQITEFATEEEVAETATADPTKIETKEVADIIIEADAVPLLEMTEKGILIDEQAADDNGTTDGITEEATAVLQSIIGELVEKSEGKYQELLHKNLLTFDYLDVNEKNRYVKLKSFDIRSF